jgi:hypothetical protein
MKLSVKRLHTIIVYIIIVGSVFVDLLNGYFNYYKNIPLPIGVAFRTVLTAFTFIYVVKLRSLLTYRLYVALIFVLWILCLIYWIVSARFIDLGMEISLFAKVIYPLFVVCYFYYVISKGYLNFETILKFAVTNGFVAGLFIIFSFITGIGFNTYAVAETNKSYGFGNSSFFKAQNDISLELLMSLCFAMYFFLKEKRFSNIIRALIIGLGTLLIGTRAGLLGGLLIVFVSVMYSAFFSKIISWFEILKRVLLFFLVIIISSVAAVLVIQKIAESKFMLNKYSLEGLQSTRASLTNAAGTYIQETQERNFLPFIFGEGNLIYTSSLYTNLGTGKGNEQAEKTAERDWIDLRGGYGILFAFTVFLFPAITFLVAIKYFFKNSRELLRFSMMLAIVLFLFHSIFVGHGLKNPAPGTLLAIIYLYVLLKGNITQKLF